MNKDIKSFYRVHRPKTFSEVVGQEHVTKTLENQIARGSVGHAYLFCGTRGTGKTTVAKIFANKITNNSVFDVFEIDAASNNRVEDVRELIDKVKFPPVGAKYKVYIVDEVHMFSSSAFNAFLKTLEEPPSHVVFILCTTEPHKLPPTVLSRCLRFDFRFVAKDDIAKLIFRIFEKEKVSAEKGAVDLIATAGGGSVRDALSVADMAASYTDGKITEEAVNEVLGAVDRRVLEKLCDAVVSCDIDGVVKVSKDIFSVGRNINAIVKDILLIIKDRYVKEKEKKYMEIYRVFSELEQTIKTAQDATTMFTGACLLCTTI